MEFFIWVQVWVCVVQTDYHTQVNKVRFHVIHERPSVDVACHRPVYSVLNVSSLEVRAVSR